MVENTKIRSYQDPLQYFFKLIVFLTVVLYCSYVYSYFFYAGIIKIKPYYWYIFTIVFACWVLIWNRFFAICNLPQRFMFWLLAYIFYTIVNFLYSTQSPFVVDKLIGNIENIALLFSFILIFKQKDGIKIAHLALLFVVLFAVPMNVLDFLIPVWSNVPGRAAGLYVNSNISGNILVLAMVASITYIPKRFRLLYCFIIGVAVLVTFSRSSWLLWGIAVMGLVLYRYIAPKKKGITIIFVLIIICISIFSLLTGGVLELTKNTEFSQYLTPNTISRLGGSGLFTDNSAVSRSAVAVHTWELFQEKPWFGFGLGFTREWDYMGPHNVGPHNMYLLMAAEGGLLGFAIFIALLVILWQLSDNLGKVLVVVYAGISLFSHNTLEQPALSVFLALIIASYNQRESDVITKNETEHNNKIILNSQLVGVNDNYNKE